MLDKELIDIEEPLELGFTFNPVRNPNGQIIHNGTNRIGDRMVFSGIPQMLFEQRGIKIVDLDEKNWMFDYNPYVVRNRIVKNNFPFQLLADQSTHHTYLKNLPILLSLPDKYCQYLGLKCTLRRPRLYRYEDIQKKRNKVVVATQGDLQGFMMNETSPRILPDHVLEQILFNYKDCEIVQVGLQRDKKFEGKNVVDKRGIPDIWDVVKEIAEAQIVISPSCGVTWISAAYLNTTKVVLCEYNEIALDSYIPRISTNHHSQWSDQNFQLFNVYENDVGVTNSYKWI